MTTSDLQSLSSRIEALPAGKRRLLAQRLSETLSDVQPAARQLVAFYVPSDKEDVDSTQLREYARGRLPDYMSPHVFVALEALPRAPGGKVDRAALADEPWAKPESQEDAFVQPRDAKEEILAAIWCQVLGLDRVGVDENYFELGGDSLLSIRILARAMKEGLHISPEVFFAQPTIARQAAAAESSALVLADEIDAVGPTPLTPIQHWFFERITIDPQHWNESMLIDVSERVGYERFEVALKEVAQRHDALRLRFAHDGNVWTQQVAAAGVPAVYHRDLTALSNQEQDADIEAFATELNQGFDLSKGCLAVAFFATPKGEPDRFLVVAHHLLIDAVSWRILLEDLELACSQSIAGQTISLPLKTTSFKAWAASQVNHAVREEMAADIGYWEDHLPGDDVLLPLDFEINPALNTVAGSQSLSFQLDPEETRSILQDLPRKFRTQINDALLTALARTLVGWTGRRSVVVDVEGHGRNAAFDNVDLSRTVGWLTTVYPVHLDLTHAEGPIAAVQAVKEQVRSLDGAGNGHGRLAYLADGIALSERLKAAPAAQLCFNYLGQIVNRRGILTPYRG